MEKDKSLFEKLYKKAFFLAIITVLYNIIEGLVSIHFGLKDEALVLLGFGVDSFIETISAVGIAIMILRIKNNEKEKQSKIEQTALYITGVCFFLLSAMLTWQAIYNIYTGHKPESGIAGIIISVLSIIFMYFIIRSKQKIGKALNSAPIIADANCGKVCVYMSIVLLVSTLLYQITEIGYLDSIGALGLVWFSIKEGKEAFEKAKGNTCDCDSDCKNN